MLTLITYLLFFAASATADSGKGTASPPPSAPPSIEVKATPDFDGLGSQSHLRPKNTDGKPHQVEARLISDHSTVVAGQTIQLGLMLNQDKGWHTYWKSPGDIGQPTTIEWNLTEGASAADYVYAVPQRFDYQGIISFGYDTQAVLLADVTLPTEITGDTITFQAKSNWLVCEVMCIQGEVDLALTLPVADSPKVGPWAPLVKHYQAQQPVTVKELDNLTVEGSLSVAQIKPDSPFSATFKVSPKGDNITLGAPPKDGIWPTYTPIAGSEWMILDANTRQNQDGSITININAESFAPEKPPEGDVIGGLFQIEVNGKMVMFEHTIPMPWPGLDVATTTADTPPPAEASSAPEQNNSAGTILSMLAMAFFGGFLLNIMPCVLPVLTMKLYGLIEQSEISVKEKKVAGLSYTAGIIASFVALAIAVIAIQWSAGAVGWGFQFQYPPYVAALATIVFAFGLSLFGVFELPALGADAANNAGAKEGPVGYFMTGVFATLLATPCSAPFLGTALGFAFSQPPAVITAFFALIGLGLAAPFLLIAFVPALYKLLPRPGAWMNTFKQLMGFTLIATTVWLIDVLSSQIGSANTTGFMAFLVFVALGSWVFGTWGGLAETGKRQLIAGLAGIGIVAIAGYLFLNLETAEASDCGPIEVSADNLDFSHEIPWQPFSDAAVQSLAGQPIFIDFTADWCLTCKVNEKTILETKAVRKAMAANGIIPLKADWTNRNDEIGDWLKRYGRAGVPFYLVLPANTSAKDLPLGEVITQGSVIEALELAAMR